VFVDSFSGVLRVAYRDNIMGKLGIICLKNLTGSLGGAYMGRFMNRLGT
jgi:hypothetical protein